MPEPGAGGLPPETFFTVWTNVFERAGLKPGETLMVQGGASGIGVTAIQMAKAFGHKVFATAGSDDKCRACEQLGAERCINYKTEDFVEVVKAGTGGKGVDVILDMVGGDYIPRELKALAPDGRIVMIAFLGGAKATVNLADIVMKRLTLTGSTLRSRPVAVKAAIARALREKVWPLIEAERIKPVVHATFPLMEAAQAHAFMESGLTSKNCADGGLKAREISGRNAGSEQRCRPSGDAGAASVPCFGYALGIADVADNLFQIRVRPGSALCTGKRLPA